MTVATARVIRYAATGMVMDFTIYIALSLAALVAESWGARAVALGLLPVAWAVTYSLTAVPGGRISDRYSRTATARVGLVLVVLTCVAFRFATETWHFYLGLPVIAVGMSLFWPALQAAIADESDQRTLNRNLGWFNISWGAGKGLGVLAGGALSVWLGKGGFVAAAAVGIVLLFVMPKVARGGGGGTAFLTGEEVEPANKRRRYLLAALIANFAAFGVGTSIVNHYPEWNAVLSRGGISYGVVVGGVFLSQTLGFALLTAWPGWRYRAAPLLLLQLLGALGVAAFATGLPVIALIPAAAAIGFSFAICYYASIYYSLHADTGRGGRAGLHEAILGTGNFLLPLASGFLVDLSGTARAPYLLCAGVVLLAVAIQGPLLRGTVRMNAAGRGPARRS